jgi:hypothetical protein
MKLHLHSYQACPLSREEVMSRKYDQFENKEDLTLLDEPYKWFCLMVDKAELTYSWIAMELETQAQIFAASINNAFIYQTICSKVWHPFPQHIRIKITKKDFNIKYDRIRNMKMVLINGRTRQKIVLDIIKTIQTPFVLEGMNLGEEFELEIWEKGPDGGRPKPKQEAGIIGRAAKDQFIITQTIRMNKIPFKPKSRKEEFPIQTLNPEYKGEFHIEFQVLN